MPTQLPTVAIVCVDTKELGKSISAINLSLRQVTPAKAVFFTNLRAYSPSFDFEIEKIDPIRSKDDYSYFMMKLLWEYIKDWDVTHVLVIQHDGYILNGDLWDDEWLQYDYIGAVWPFEDKKHNVGNGGFSLRSKKLIGDVALDGHITATHMEDAQICRSYRSFLERDCGIRFAPESVANQFSFELAAPKNKTFGFHGDYHQPYQELVVIKRSGAIGDCVALEPVLKYFHKQGKKVAIDMPLDIAMMYSKHHYLVHHITQIDPEMPRTVIDLDGAYENNPKQLHLKSYFETAGVTDYSLEKPSLYFKIGDHNRLFENYIIFHISDRDQSHRNVFRMRWDALADELYLRGYTIIQVGLTNGYKIRNAIQMNTPGVNMLMWTIAGATAFIGVDSGPSCIAVALNVPSVIFSGSVNLEYIHPDMKDILWIKNDHDQIEGCAPYCWHEVVSNVGQDCVVVDKDDIPPCVNFEREGIVDEILEFINSKA